MFWVIVRVYWVISNILGDFEGVLDGCYVVSKCLLNYVVCFLMFWVIMRVFWDISNVLGCFEAVLCAF